MSLSVNGVSTTTERDYFRCEVYKPVGLEDVRVQWDYRDASGELHTGVARDVLSAKAAARRYGYRG